MGEDSGASLKQGVWKHIAMHGANAYIYPCITVFQPPQKILLPDMFLVTAHDIMLQQTKQLSFLTGSLLTILKIILFIELRIAIGIGDNAYRQFK